MHAGTWPLMMVVNAEQVNLHWGLTYATVVTNFVPRAIWPKSHRLVVWCLQTSMRRDFMTNTPLLPQVCIRKLIMNFGKEFGVIFGSAAAIFIVLCIVSFLQTDNTGQLARGNRSHKLILELVVYVYSTWAAILMSGEFTSVVIGVLLKVIVLIALYLFTRVRVNLKV